MSAVHEATKRKTKVAIMNAVHDLPVLVARDKGYFRDEGLDIEFVTTPGMAQVTTSHTVKFDTVFDRPLELRRGQALSEHPGIAMISRLVSFS